MNQALGEAATHLPWLSPCAASLLALARAPAGAAWSEVRLDPGAVLLLVRHSAATQAASGLSFFPALVSDPNVLAGAVRDLDPGTRGPGDTAKDHRDAFAALPGRRVAGSGFVDWGRPEAAPIYQASLTYARLAHYLAERSGRCDPENAWVAGLLAPLGWLAAAGADPGQAAACLADPAFVRNPVSTQQRRWGLDQAAIARRLCLAWQLPRWLATIPSYLGLPVQTATSLGADPDLFLTVQLAVRLAQQQGSRLQLAVGAAIAQTAAALELSTTELEEASAQAATLVEPETESLAGPARWAAPDSVPLLRDLLTLAAENRRLHNRVALERLEKDVDALQQGLEGHLAAEAERLQASKLSALAEFAAGAGHEINNPLAVISGQAQYLLGHEAEPPRQKALQTIIGQTRRIHHLLSDLMQFARPSRPQKQELDVGALVREVAASLQELAAQRRVRLLYPDFADGETRRNGDAGTAPGEPIPVSPCPPVSASLYADRQQVSTALACLLRNAIEAAPAEGWAGVRLERPAADRLELVVEDSGSGPTQPQREHLFDPFYSGRTAGRGRGLGLATAWRLAREHGGEVRFDGEAGGPTRFVLSLPQQHVGSNGTGR